jgi:Flp pilus assembly protein TadB
VDTSLAVAIVAAVVAVVTAAATFLSSKRATDVNEQAMAVQWAKEVRADAADARREVKEAQTDLRTLSRRLLTISGRCDELEAYLLRVVGRIHDPDMTMPRLREMVPPELPPSIRNGNH